MKRGDSTRVYNVAVVGLSGIERDKGQFGIGKSCLCNRFVRPRADDYFPEHISVLSITDFSGRVVNNDHFLYWGYATKAFEDGPEIGFNVIEQTEFIDDATFQAFKGGKMETYIKRCTASRVYSAEKLMYICKSQLGIEKEFEQKVLPDGRLTIDGFILVYDVSNVQGRSFERQTEFSATILYNILKAKKPVILVTTKNDEQCEAYIKEAEKMLTRKEFRQINIPIVETSAHENINVDLAFLLLAQLIDKVKNRIRPLTYIEQARIRKEMLDSVSDSFQSLIQSHVTDHRSVWIPVYRELLKYPAFQRYIEYFGEECAQRLFRRHLKRLKDDFLSRRERRYLERLPDVLENLFPDSLPSCQANDWDIMVNRIKDHPECSMYFIVTPGLQENDWTWNSSESSNEANIRDNRIPIGLLNTGEAENVWRNLINSLQAGRKIGEFRQQFKFLLDNTPYVTPGKSLNELQVLFMGHECFEMLSGNEIQTIYEQHQAELYDKARRSFQELMLENAEVFVSVQSSSPVSTVTQQSLRDLVEILQEDSRYKALDRLDQERRLQILQHLGFVHCPIKEHCPSFPNCMDCVVERLLISTAPKVQQQYNNNGNSTNNLSTDAVLSLYLIGKTELVNCVKFVLEEILDDDEYELDGIVYSVELKSGDEIPFNSFPSSTSGHLQARLVLYSTNETLEDTKTYLEKALINNLEEEDNISFSEPPIVIVFNTPYLEDNLEERECLGNDGQALADSLGCGFVDVSGSDERPSTQLLAEAVQSLVRSLRDRVNPHQLPLSAQVVLRGEPDIRIIMCMFCGDSYGVGSLMSPLFTLPACQQTSANSLSLLTFLGDRRRSVQIIMSSYHNATSHRDELVHGLILVYSASRVASFAALKSFSNNVPNLPIQILAVTEEGAATTMFTSSLGQKLITEGNSLADELRGHFATWSGEQMVGIYTPFFRQVWDQKTDIEKAFRMESPPMYRPPPDIAPRNNKITQQQIQDQQNNLTDDDIYEQLPSLSEDESVGSGDALVKPSMIRQRQAQQLPNKPSSSDNFIREFDKFDNNSVFLSGATRRSHRDLESMIGGPRTQQPQGAFLAFATGRRSHNSKPLINNNGNSKPFRQNSAEILQGNNNASSIGKINMSEYQTVTDALAKMNLRFPNTSPPYNNLQAEEYVSDTGHRNRNNRSRRNNHPQPQTDSSSASYSDPEDFSRPRHKKKSLKGRTHPPKPKAIFTPIPQVPKGFIPVQYQLSGDSGIFSSRNKSLLEEGSPDISPVDLDKKPFEGTKDEKPPKPKKEKPKKLSKSKSTEQQQQPQPQQVLNFTTSLEEAIRPKGILERCVRFIEEEGLVMEGLYRVPGNRIHVENLFSKLAEDPDTDLHSLDIPVNAVATALKDFLAKRLPPPFPTDLMNEVERIALIPDRSLRLLELKQFLLHLPPPNLSVLRIIFSHLVRVAENSRINAMDSKNLAICWWPTLLPFSFVDMMRFESMRPSLEDIVQTMIDQYPFLFCGQDDVVMV